MRRQQLKLLNPDHGEGLRIWSSLSEGQRQKITQQYAQLIVQTARTMVDQTIKERGEREEDIHEA